MNYRTRGMIEMKEFIQKLMGYILITAGVYFLYLSLFKYKSLSSFFQKRIYQIIIIILCIIACIFGWLLVV